jgi:hypothetical protein
MRAAALNYHTVFALAAFTLGGCAHTYVDQSGERHVVGLVHLTLPVDGGKQKSADWMRMRTIGLALSSTDIGSALEFGYSDNTLAVVRNNSCVRVDRLPASLFSTSGAVHAPQSFVR